MAFLKHVAEQEPWLRLNYEHYRLELGNKSFRLSEENESLIQENYMALLEHLDIGHVLPLIIHDGILEHDQPHRLQIQPDRQAQNRELLSTVKKKGDKGFYSLCRAILQYKPQEGKNNFNRCYWFDLYFEM